MEEIIYFIQLNITKKNLFNLILLQFKFIF